MKKSAVLFILSGLVLLPLSGCQTSQTRDAKVDSALATKKAAPSGLMVGEILTEPQTGFIQESEASNES